MSHRHHHRRYDYHKPGSGAGLRRDILRRRLGIICMLVVGLAIIVGLIYFSLPR